MTIAQSLEEGIGAVRQSPIIAATVTILSLVQLPTQFAPVVEPPPSRELSLAYTGVTVLVVPFIFSGLIGMAEEALDTGTSLRTFVISGSQHYLSMLGAYLLFIAGMVFVGFTASFASTMVMVALLVPTGLLSGGATPAVIAAGLLSMVAFILLILGPLYFVQFSGQAIVINDLGALDGFERSIWLVRGNWVSVLRYSLLVLVGGLLIGTLGSIPSMLLSTQTTSVAQGFPIPEFSTTTMLILAVVGSVILGLAGSLFLTFSVAYYRSLEPVEEIDESTAPKE